MIESFDPHSLLISYPISIDKGCHLPEVPLLYNLKHPWRPLSILESAFNMLLVTVLYNVNRLEIELQIGFIPIEFRYYLFKKFFQFFFFSVIFSVWILNLFFFRVDYVTLFW